ncbi:MAG: CAAX prenyl protease-related protein, partial [Aquabacterium sp.]|nr:CAAX prenyl protease-related protein [Aquabacterium sp.]
MKSLLSPAAWARVIPFALFMALLALRANWPAGDGGVLDPRWLYGVSVLVVGGSLVYFWRRYGELGRGSGLSFWHALLSMAVGVVVFVLWVWLTEPWMMLGEASASFRPVDNEGQLLWGLVIVRWIGAAMLVPVMEELFWRSYLMRWVDKPDFEAQDPGAVTLRAMLLSSLVFMLAHNQWLAA